MRPARKARGGRYRESVTDEQRRAPGCSPANEQDFGRRDTSEPTALDEESIGVPSGGQSLVDSAMAA